VGGWRKPRYANTLARLFAIDPRSDRFVSVGGGRGTAHGRGGGGDSKVHLMRWLESPEKEGPHVHLAEVVWARDDPLLRSRGNPSISAIAVSDNAVLLGLSILGPESDRIYREGRAEMPYRLRILDLSTGQLIRDVPLSGHPLQGGIALADGRVYVATEDGSVTAFGRRGVVRHGRDRDGKCRLCGRRHVREPQHTGRGPQRRHVRHPGRPDPRWNVRRLHAVRRIW